MLVEKIIARSGELNLIGADTDEVYFEWYELNKKILRKTTSKGLELGFRLADGAHGLRDGDIVAQTSNEFIVARIIPCKCLEVSWHDWRELASICYEVGNRHAPLFINTIGDRLLLLFDEPMQVLLTKLGAHICVVTEKLITPLVAFSGHSHAH
jgi:urease accessory protein